jgi:hypothetical protein
MIIFSAIIKNISCFAAPARPYSHSKIPKFADFPNEGRHLPEAVLEQAAGLREGFCEAAPNRRF